MKCEICNKEIDLNNCFKIKYLEKNVCDKHYAQYLKFGKFIDTNQNKTKDINSFSVDKKNNIAYVFTNDMCYNETGCFIIDSEDLEKVVIKKWRLWKNRVYTGVKRPVTIYSFLIGKGNNGYDIDHINQNPLDNRKSNLRIVRHRDNIKNSPVKTNNTSGFSGIYFDTKRNKWCVEIKSDYVKCFLGRYKNIEDACYTRYIAEKIVFKDYRSKSNDDKLLELANKSTQKETIKKYVASRIEKIIKADKSH